MAGNLYPPFHFPVVKNTNGMHENRKEKFPKSTSTHLSGLRLVFFGSFVFNVEIVFYYALLCCPWGVMFVVFA